MINDESIVTTPDNPGDTSRISYSVNKNAEHSYNLSVIYNGTPIILLKMDNAHPLEITQRNLCQEERQIDASKSSPEDELVQATSNLTLRDTNLFRNNEAVDCDEIMETEETRQHKGGEILTDSGASQTHPEGFIGQTSSLRRSRTFSAQQSSKLYEYFKCCKYWSSYHYSQMAKELNVNPIKIRAWFTRARRNDRLKNQILRQ